MPSEIDLKYLNVFLTQKSMFKHIAAQAVLGELLLLKNEKILDRYYKGMKGFISKLVDIAVNEGLKTGSNKRLKFSSDIIKRTRHLSTETTQRPDLKQIILIQEGDYLEGFPRVKKLIKKVLKQTLIQTEKSKSTSSYKRHKGKKKKGKLGAQRNQSAVNHVSVNKSEDLSSSNFSTSVLSVSSDAKYGSSSDFVTDSTLHEKTPDLSSSHPTFTEESVALSASDDYVRSQKMMTPAESVPALCKVNDPMIQSKAVNDTSIDCFFVKPIRAKTIGGIIAKF